MKKSKFSETQIVSILKQSDAGVPVKDLCRGRPLRGNGRRTAAVGGSEVREPLRGVQSLYWVNPHTGKRSAYIEVAAGGERVQRTFVGHYRIAAGTSHCVAVDTAVIELR